MKSRLNKINIALLLALGGMVLPATAAQLVLEANGSGNTLRFQPIGGGNSQSSEEIEGEEGSVTEPLTWAKLYQNTGRLAVSSDSQLADQPIPLGGLSLTFADLPTYQYPVSSVGSVDISGNIFPSLSFLPSGLTVNGSLDATSTQMQDITPMLYFSAINGDVLLQGNPDTVDISSLGYLPISAGSSVILDDPSQYSRLINEESPTCVAAKEGDITVSNSDGSFVFNDYCTFQDDWVRFFQGYGQHGALVEDSELYNLSVTMPSYVNNTALPTVSYPVPKIYNFTMNNYSWLSNVDFLETVTEAEMMQFYTTYLEDISGLRNLKTVNGSLNFHVEDTKVTAIGDSLQNLESVGILTFYGAENGSTSVLRDISGVENIGEVGEVRFGYKNWYDKLPSADAPLCQYIKENAIRVRVNHRIDTNANYFCDSGSEWQELMEDTGSIYYRGYVMTTEEGVDVQPLQLHGLYTSSYSGDDDIPSVPYPNPNPPLVELQWNYITNIEFLAPIESTEKVTILYNHYLLDLDGLEGMEADTVEIYYNNRLMDISAITEMTINDTLVLMYNDDLTDFSPLNNYTSNLQTIRLETMGSEESRLDGEGELCKAIGRGDITLLNENNNQAGATYFCNSHEWIEYLQARGRLSTMLTSVEHLADQNLNLYGLGTITNAAIPQSNYPSSAVRAVQISGTGFTNIDFMSDITEADQSVIIAGNDSLTDLSGISNLGFTADGPGLLYIYNNDALTDISPLSNLGPNVKEIRFKNPYYISTFMDINGTTCQRHIAGELTFSMYNGGNYVPATSDYCK